MPQGNALPVFLNCIESKTDLIKLVTSYLRDIGTRRSFSMPVIFTDSNETWEASSDSIKMLFLYNHEEADSRQVLHACPQDTNVVVVVAKDTDVLILLIYAYEVVKLKCSWHMKVHAFLGSRISRYLPEVHATTGCDTTSFFYGIGKVKVL